MEESRFLSISSRTLYDFFTGYESRPHRVELLRADPEQREQEDEDHAEQRVAQVAAAVGARLAVRQRVQGRDERQACTHTQAHT